MTGACHDGKMAGMAHTPGPWMVSGPTDTVSTVGDPYGHGPMRIADPRGWGHLTGQGACKFSEAKAVGIQHANACLISAAPELLTALKDLRAMIVGEHGASAYENINGERADAAIAKAEGR